MVVKGKKKAVKSKKVVKTKKPPDPKAECKDCEETISDDDPAIECDICKTFVCLECTELSSEVNNYLVEQEVDVPYICNSCKQQIPKVRELLGLEAKYKQLQEEVEQMKVDLANQELKITNYEQNQKTLSDRLEELEKTPFNTQFPALLTENQPQNQHVMQNFVQTHVRPVLHTEIGEFEQIQAIKLNLFGRECRYVHMCALRLFRRASKSDHRKQEEEEKGELMNRIALERETDLENGRA